jgi:hypothetical protein
MYEPSVKSNDWSEENLLTCAIFALVTILLLVIFAGIAILYLEKMKSQKVKPCAVKSVHFMPDIANKGKYTNLINNLIILDDV